MTLLHHTRNMPLSTPVTTSSTGASSPCTLIDTTIEESQQADEPSRPSYELKEWEDVACRVKFWLSPPEHQRTTTVSASWHACIILKTKDLPRLMLQGFHWTAAENLEPYAGCFHQGERIRAQLPEKGWDFCRVYFLAEKPHSSRRHRGSQLWVGRVEVFAPRLDVLRGFSLDRDLHRSYITKAQAFDIPEVWSQYYRYNKAHLEQCINVVTDNTPLSGWWPWPKENKRS